MSGKTPAGVSLDPVGQLLGALADVGPGGSHFFADGRQRRHRSGRADVLSADIGDRVKYY